MKLPITSALLLLAVLVTKSEADWVNGVGDVTKTVTENSIRGVLDFLKGVVRRHPLGKRSVDLGDLFSRVGGQLLNGVASSFLNEVDLVCTQFNDDLKNKKGLTAGDLAVAFGQTDEDKNGRLSKPELKMFENVVDVIQRCLEHAKRRAAQGK